jgi:hypothetical protein
VQPRAEAKGALLSTAGLSMKGDAHWHPAGPSPIIALLKKAR